jgi:hypothetical protein
VIIQAFVWKEWEKPRKHQSGQPVSWPNLGWARSSRVLSGALDSVVMGQIPFYILALSSHLHVGSPRGP